MFGLLFDCGNPEGVRAIDMVKPLGGGSIMHDPNEVLVSPVREMVSGADGQVGAPEVEVFGVEAVCGIHKRPFLLLFERKGLKSWCAQRSYPLPDSLGTQPVQQLMEKQGVSIRPASSLVLVGGLTMCSDYVGCAWCLDANIFKCGCGALACLGAQRTHDTHKDGLCGRCDRWICLRRSVDLSIEKIAGQAVVPGGGMGVEMRRCKSGCGGSVKAIAAPEPSAIVAPNGLGSMVAVPVKRVIPGGGR
jgi:hypothetical protein